LTTDANGATQMQKLINAFRADTSAKNAEKIRKHAQKSMMSVCMISPEDIAFLKAHGIIL
jgi:hypothetical protein